MKLVATLVLCLAAGSAYANCTGFGSFQTCTDNSGNNYTVQRSGNTTFLNGSSPNGTTWNQTSQTMGNTTFHNGQAANGNAWNGTSQNIGNMQFNQGTNSRGQPYSSTCQRIGNQTFCN